MPDSAPPVQPPWTVTPDALARMLKTDLRLGLEEEDARARLERYGENVITAQKQEPWHAILLRQAMNLIALLLVLAAVMSAVLGEWLEVAAIAVALLLNVLIGFITELKALRSIAALQRMAQTSARVIRGGRVKEIPTPLLVPGDLVALEAGDVLAADMRVVESSRLRANESALTGESLPVDKTAEPLPESTILAERANMLFKGTALHLGTGLALITATGMHTELGRIAALTQSARAEQSPLEKRLNSLGGKLFWITLAVAGVVVAAGLHSGMALPFIIQTAIALAVATIPEGLPIVATIALAQGMWRMAAHNAVITRLSAVETLGTVNVLCSDKTGTLTENRMRLDSLLLARQDGAPEAVSFQNTPAHPPQLAAAVRAGTLCNNAQLNHEDDDPVGDPLELALLQAGRTMALERDALLQDLPELREEAFDPETVMMATYHQDGDGVLVAVKGAPERVLAACSRVRTPAGDLPLSPGLRQAWEDGNAALAGNGLRLLGLAEKRVESPQIAPYDQLTLLGLAGLADPPRAEMRDVVARLRQQGVRLVMVTGDQPATALAVGQALGLVDAAGKDGGRVLTGADLKPTHTLSPEEKHALLQTNVFARVTPEQKLDLIALYQEAGHVVGMTGDGVNDAPALKKSDIGVAMGLRGTQVAQEAADLVLKDDALATVAMAVDQGRVIFNNIRKFIVYLLSGNVGQLMLIGAAMGLGLRLPLLPLQILYLNMICDIFPALALGLGQGTGAPPPPQPRGVREPVLTAGHWTAIFVYGAVIAASIFGAYWLALHRLLLTQEQAVAVTFLTLALARIWHTFNLREPGTGLLVNDVTCNPFAWGAVAVSLGLVCIAVFVPTVAAALHVVPLGRDGWLTVLLCSLAPSVVLQLYKSLIKSTRPRIFSMS
ncbi:cation-translocating P-type ATPase [Megalodesulfovibrio paquesii]